MGLPRFLEEWAHPSFRALFPLQPLENTLFGGLTFADRWRLLAPGDALDGAERGTVLLAHPLAIPDPDLIRAIDGGEGERLWRCAAGPLAARIDLKRLERSDLPIAEAIAGLPEEETGGEIVERPWSLVAGNAARIAEDDAFLERLGKFPSLPATAPAPFGAEGAGGAEVLGRDVRVGRDCRFEPFVLLDAREGPIRIGDRVTVEAHTVLRGPLWIRNDARVRAGARIGEGTTLGEGARVGGEVEGTLFGAFSNKQHDGFLGHAVVGEWVNLGAATNNSDLKNNYGPVRLDWGEGPAETGLLKLGCFIGDHVKTAIGTRIGTGTVIGPMANLFGGSGFVSGRVPPFTWGEEGGVYRLSEAVDTLRKAMSRRLPELERAGRPLEPTEELLRGLRELWDSIRGKRS
ncbi:MAG: hypothetical protein JW958_06860 [Candidatus Eisenbacteria bacterium]|nr:hypothetical protein [Candidatus Eisenbacteria bacterium]